MNRKVEIEKRIDQLIKSFDHYLAAFDNEGPFTKYDQHSTHKRTIELRFQLGSAKAAIHHSTFLKILYDTLQAWGIGARGSVLVPFDEFASTLQKHQMEIAALDGLMIDDESLKVAEVADHISKLIRELRIVENEAKLVPCSKALHHVLPDLVVPMDREYTRTFFGWHVPEFQYKQQQVFKHAFHQFVKIARSTRPSQFVGQGWRTSRTKILDNALVGFCIIEKLPAPS